MEKNRKNRFKGGYILPEHKIDSIIKEYLRERDEFLDLDEPIVDEYEFSPKTSDAISDMIDGLAEMVDDMDIIKEKEGNVIVLDNIYASEYLEDIMENLKSVINDLKNLPTINNNDEIEL